MLRGLVRLSAVALVCFAALRALGQDCVPHWLQGEAIPGVAGSANSAVLWDPDGPGPQPEVLVVVGNFPVAGKVQASNIASWDGTSWAPLGAGRPSGTVTALAVFNGNVIAATGYSGPLA